MKNHVTDLAIFTAPVGVRVPLLLRIGLQPQAAVQVAQSREVVAGYDVLAPPNHDSHLHLVEEAFAYAAWVGGGMTEPGQPGLS